MPKKLDLYSPTIHRLARELPLLPSLTITYPSEKLAKQFHQEWKSFITTLRASMKEAEQSQNEDLIANLQDLITGWTSHIARVEGKRVIFTQRDNEAIITPAAEALDAALKAQAPYVATPAFEPIIPTQEAILNVLMRKEKEDKDPV